MGYYGFGYWAFHRLRPYFGAITSFAALTVVSGALLGVCAALLPLCNDGVTDIGCPVQESAQFAVVGLLLPLLALLVGMPARALWYGARNFRSRQARRQQRVSARPGRTRRGGRR